MPPTPEQTQLVRQSFGQVLDQSSELMEIFYDRFFELNPEIHHLFTRVHMREQSVRLFKMLMLIVDSIENPDEFLPLVRQMSGRHVGYGVKPEHYQRMGESLIWALEQTLKESFTPEVKAAWEITYQTIAEASMEATQEVPKTDS